MFDVSLSVIYYSATGTIHAMAERLAAAAQKAGAQVRLRQVAELAPESAIAGNPKWREHAECTPRHMQSMWGATSIFITENGWAASDVIAAEGSTTPTG